jgi:hypothetical protein
MSSLISLSLISIQTVHSLLFYLSVEKDKEIVQEDGFAVPFDPTGCVFFIPSGSVLGGGKRK